MAEPPPYVPPKWKILENYLGGLRHAKMVGWENALRLRDIHAPEKNATAAREHKAIAQNPHSAGHDFVREWQERTGQSAERSRER